MGKGTKSGVDYHTLDLQSLSRQVTERSPLPMAAMEGEHAHRALCQPRLLPSGIERERRTGRSPLRPVQCRRRKSAYRILTRCTIQERPKLVLRRYTLHPILYTGLMRYGRFRMLPTTRSES